MKSTSGGAERSTIRCTATKVCARNPGCIHYNKILGLFVPSSDYSVCLDCTDMDSSIFCISPIRGLVHLSDDHGGRCKATAAKYSESMLQRTFGWMVTNDQFSQFDLNSNPVLVWLCRHCQSRYFDSGSADICRSWGILNNTSKVEGKKNLLIGKARAVCINEIVKGDSN